MRAPAAPVAPMPPTAVPRLAPNLSSSNLTPESTAPNATATTPAPANDHADAAYRDLLTRVREEREQLGQLISHPF